MVGDVDRNQGPELFDALKYKYRIHASWDYDWNKNKNWQCKGQMNILAKMDHEICIRMGGQDANKESIEEEHILQPGKVIQTKNEYYTVLYTQTTDIPSGELVVHCEDINKAERITPSDWGNIWAYDSLVYITAYSAFAHI